jgi:hypothetical protein
MRTGLIRRRILSSVVFVGLLAVGLSGCIVVPVPGYATQGPGYGAPPVAYGPGYGAPPAAYGPGYGAPPAAYGPGYGAPPTAYGASVYVAPPPVYVWGPWWGYRRWR